MAGRIRHLTSGEVQDIKVRSKTVDASWHTNAAPFSSAEARREDLTSWIRRYNTLGKHYALNRRTPLQAVSDLNNVVRHHSWPPAVFARTFRLRLFAPPFPIRKFSPSRRRDRV